MEKSNQITKEQWAVVAAELLFPHGRVELMCDGFRLTLSVEMVSKLKYGICVYVDGFFKGEWIGKDCEERRRFLRPVEKFLWPEKMRRDLIKIYGGKRAPKAKVAEVNTKHIAYYSWWTSAVSLHRHLRKHNTHIELVKVGY